jgi:hypothetical protein
MIFYFVESLLIAICLCIQFFLYVSIPYDCLYNGAIIYNKHNGSESRILCSKGNCYNKLCGLLVESREVTIVYKNSQDQLPYITTNQIFIISTFIVLVMMLLFKIFICWYRYKNINKTLNENAVLIKSCGSYDNSED